MASKTRSRKSPVRTGTTRRRKAKRSADWGLIVWVLLFVNIGMGMAFSPITAPVKVMVEGARGGDMAGFEKILGETVETPWMRVDRFKVAYEMSEPTHIAKVVYEPNVFGRATLKVEYEEPVAELGEGSGMFLSKDGEVFLDELGAKAQIVQLPEDFLQTSGCVIGLWPKGGVIETIDLMDQTLPQMDYRLEVDDRSVLSLEYQDGPRVVLGTSALLKKKIEALAIIIAEEPETFEKAEEINLTAPDRPTVRP